MKAKTSFGKYAGPPFLILFCLGMTLAVPSFATFESSLRGIRSQLTDTILPILSVIGLGFAAISFFTGSPNAKQHIFYAIIGSIIGFGAQAIVDFISSTVH